MRPKLLAPAREVQCAAAHLSDEADELVRGLCAVVSGQRGRAACCTFTFSKGMSVRKRWLAMNALSPSTCVELASWMPLQFAPESVLQAEPR